MNHPQQSAPVRPGVRTSEFWLTLLVVLGTAVAVTYETEPWARIVGAVVAALTAMGYTANRARVKNGPSPKTLIIHDAQPAPTEETPK